MARNTWIRCCREQGFLRLQFAPVASDVPALPLRFPFKTGIKDLEPGPDPHAACKPLPIASLLNDRVQEPDPGTSPVA